MERSRLFLSILLIISFLCPTISMALKNDFLSPMSGWKKIPSDDIHSGDQKLLAINNKNANEKIYLYWMAPDAETKIQQHSKIEEVTIVQGSLYWLNEDKSIQKILKVGDYIDRQPGIQHGPFKSGPNGCLMYVRFH